MSIKRESVEEFLARGGKITVVPTAEPQTKHVVQRKNALTGVVSMISMDEAELFFSETRAKPKQTRVPKINIDALPPELRLKFVDKLLKGEDDED